jgi:hypothetical protein
MPDLHMGDAVYRFQADVIERVVRPGQPGNYALGERDDAGQFYPLFIGWSHRDVAAELKSRLGTVTFSFFKFTTSGPRNAYDLACANYHTFGAQLQNGSHPEAPPGSGYTCFLCGR